MATDWRTASREPVGLAPDPAQVKEAVVQVYGARAVGGKGLFGVHTWVAVKPTDAREWTVYEVIGWRLRYSDSALAIHNRGPDERWFGAVPELLADRRGPGAEALIARGESVVGMDVNPSAPAATPTLAPTEPPQPTTAPPTQPPATQPPAATEAATAAPTS